MATTYRYPKVNKCLEANLPSKAYNGYLYITTDTGKLYLDSDNVRIEITDILESTAASITALTYIKNKFYYAVDTNTFYYYTGSEWQTLSSSSSDIELEEFSGDTDTTSSDYSYLILFDPNQSNTTIYDSSYKLMLNSALQFSDDTTTFYPSITFGDMAEYTDEYGYTETYENASGLVLDTVLNGYTLNKGATASVRYTDGSRSNASATYTVFTVGAFGSILPTINDQILGEYESSGYWMARASSSSRKQDNLIYPGVYTDDEPSLCFANRGQVITSTVGGNFLVTASSITDTTLYTSITLLDDDTEISSYSVTNGSIFHIYIPSFMGSFTDIKMDNDDLISIYNCGEEISSLYGLADSGYAFILSLMYYDGVAYIISIM